MRSSSVRFKSVRVALVAAMIAGTAAFPAGGYGAPSGASASPGTFKRSADAASTPVRRTGPAKLDSTLAHVRSVAASKGRSAAVTDARSRGLRATGSTVEVVVVGDAAAIKRAVKAAGGSVTGSTKDRIQANVPVDMLDRVALATGVDSVRKPMKPRTVAVGQGPAETNAIRLHAAGVNGTGVKVGVIDLGFSGIDALLGADLPASVKKWGVEEPATDKPIEGTGSEIHGTAVTQVVHDMAPGAQLYIAQVETEVEFAQAVAWMQASGVKVVNASLVWSGDGPLDGTGTVNDIVSSAVSSGIFWANAAGNQRKRHWTGDFTDVNGDGYLDLGGEAGDEQWFAGEVGEQVAATLTWKDSWTNASQDYDLELWYYPNATDDPEIVWWSSNIQDGSSGKTPVEEFEVSLPKKADGVTSAYSWAIRKVSASSNDVDFDLHDWNQDLYKSVAQYSIVAPADNGSDGFMATGANYRASMGYPQEPYSSEGPTRDSRMAPEISSPDGVNSTVYGSYFTGTSAASPQLAGAAALVAAAQPGYSASQIEQYLEGHAVDLGTPGADNQYGAGRLYLSTDLIAGEGDALAASPVAASISTSTTPDDYWIDLMKGDDLTLSLESTSTDPVVSAVLLGSSGTTITALGTTPKAYTATANGRYKVRVSASGASTEAAAYTLSFQRRKATLLSLSTTDANPAYGKSTKVYLNMADSDSLPATGTVTVQRSYDGKTWATYSTKSMPLNGSLSFAYTPVKRTYLRAVFAGKTAPALKAVTSSALKLNRKAYLTTPTSKTKVAAGSKFTLKGIIKPRHTTGTYPVKVMFYRYEGTKWVHRKTVSARASARDASSSYYTATTYLPSKGTWKAVARVDESSVVAQTYSGSKYIYVNSTTMSMSATASTVNYARSSTLSGYLRNGTTGAALASRTVYLESSYNKVSWTRVATLKTSTKGKVSKSVRPNPSNPYAVTYYRFRYPGTTTVSASTSAVKAISRTVWHLQGTGGTTVTKAWSLPKGQATVVADAGADSGDVSFVRGDWYWQTQVDGQQGFSLAVPESGTWTVKMKATDDFDLWVY